MKSPLGVESREDLVAFVRALAGSARDAAEVWENRSLPEFLEALAGWAEDMDGYFVNRGDELPVLPTWHTFALMLAAARVYE